MERLVQLVYIQDYLTVPGVIRARRFMAVEGQPKYLTVYEFERPDVPKSPAWNRVRDKNPWTHRIRHHMRLDAGSPVVFKRINPGSWAQAGGGGGHMIKRVTLLTRKAG